MNTEDKFYFGKPGQPERFGNIDDWNTATIKLKKLQQEIVVLMNEAVNASNSALSKKIAYPYRDITSTLDAVNPKIKAMQEVIGHLNNLHGRIGFSRPGSPDKFDASSLDRGNFAEASKSPMLGKLLSEKAMPDGGWRAVQVGSDTLVISFEDADLARDFGRRAASKGYSATSPVATTGRYWNVEVKNGK